MTIVTIKIRRPTRFGARRPISTVLTVTSLLLLAGCGGDKPSTADSTGRGAPPLPSTGAAPAPTGTTITIEMTTDEKGNYFTPNEVTAHPGDVLRFTLVQGVHNVHFLADSNPGAANLPAATAFAQLPGQTLDVPVAMAAGKSYYFQCDPHALLGMRGRVRVE